MRGVLSMSKSRIRRLAARLSGLLPAALWRPVRSIATGVVTPILFSLTSGHWQSSIAMCACTAAGAPIPWYTYPAIDFLSQRKFERRTVLEFGGGQSTLWWSMRARSVLTVEEDAGWHERLRSRVGDNVGLHHIPVDHATRSVALIKDLLDAQPIRAFDVIVIDGHLRQEVTALAFDYLAPDGAIILDNSEGYGFYEEIKGRDCRRIDFFGFAPGVSLRHCTSIVFVDDCFLLKPDIPIPVIEEIKDREEPRRTDPYAAPLTKAVARRPFKSTTA
jgi:hypothetical protein